MTCLLDTSIILLLVKGKNEKLEMEFEQALFDGRDVCISVITYYEIKRGYLSPKHGTMEKQLLAFDEFVKRLTLLSFTYKTANIASTIWAELKRNRKNISSCDVLIGATAIEKDLPVVANDKHFDYITDIKRENWSIS